jgi:hypothetical protein
VTERAAYWVFGLLLSGAITIALGRGLVSERGIKVVPLLCALGLAFGLILGWAINGYIDYVRASAEMR